MESKRHMNLIFSHANDLHLHFMHLMQVVKHRHCKLPKNMEEKVQQSCAKTGVPRKQSISSLSPVNIHVLSTQQILLSDLGENNVFGYPVSCAGMISELSIERNNYTATGLWVIKAAEQHIMQKSLAR